MITFGHLFDNFWTPLLIVPCESKFKKSFNIVFSTSREDIPSGMIGKSSCAWDSRNIIKDLELTGLGESTVFFNANSDESKEWGGLSELLNTNQVDILFVSSPENSRRSAIIKHVNELSGIRSPLVIDYYLSILELDRWLNTSSHLFEIL